MRATRIRLSDGSSWPRPALESDDESGVGWMLTYAPDQMTREEQLEAAAVIRAYGYLLTATTRARRDSVCREVRAALNSTPTDTKES